MHTIKTIAPTEGTDRPPRGPASRCRRQGPSHGGAHGMIIATLAMAGVLALALAAPAGSGAPVSLSLIGLVILSLYGIYDTTRSDQ